MFQPSRFAAILLAGAALVAGAPLSAQRHDAHTAASDFSPQAVGAQFMVMEVEATDEAKAHFLRGLALLHNFEYAFAAKEFRLAQAADPDFAMAYWGEAMTHNHPLWAQQDRDAALAILARLGADPVARAAKARSEKEGLWLGAVETLFGTSGEPASKVERDLAYLGALEAMLAAYPDDIDMRAFTGLAILGSSHGGRQIPIYMEAAGVLEPGFMTHEFHPGILHYLIHSYDDPVHAPLGERMAERYAVIAPDAGHAQHMVSHIYLALADWPATELANVNAANVVNRQRAAQGRGPTSCGHYNEWLAYALLQQGKDARDLVSQCAAQVSEAASRAIAQIAGDGGDMSNAGNSDDAGRVANAWSAARMAMFLGVETGEWLDPVGLPPVAANRSARFVEAHAAFMQAIAADPDAARRALARMEEIQGEMAAADRTGRDAAYAAWPQRAIERGHAMIEMATGDSAAGIAALEQAAAAELALPVVFGPPAIYKPSYEILGELYLAQGQKAQAKAAFEKALELAPGRRLSLEGLARAGSS